MRKILAGMIFMALAGTLSLAAPPQDRDDRHDNGKHKGQEKHERKEGDHHDNGGSNDGGSDHHDNGGSDHHDDGHHDDHHNDGHHDDDQTDQIDYLIHNAMR